MGKEIIQFELKSSEIEDFKIGIQDEMRLRDFKFKISAANNLLARPIQPGPLASEAGGRRKPNHREDQG